MQNNANVVNEGNISKNKKKNILILIGVLVLLIVLFLLWFFNRKFDVIFDLNNGTKEDTIQVKYNKVIDEKDIKTKEDLGETFINWYEVIDVKDGEDVLAEKSFDFTTKIKQNIKLKAIYEGKVETITISFDSKGGSKISDIIINKNSELTLPKEPTYSGYNFVDWTTKDGKIVANKTKFSEDTTLYAKWKKVEVQKPTPKPQEPKKEESKPEVKEESISLKIDKKIISVNGFKTAKAVATVQNKQGDVTYSIDGECVEIDSKTGVITAKSCPFKAPIVTVTATSKTGKTATETIQIEKDLVVFLNGNASVLYENDTSIGDIIPPYNIMANQEVTFEGACARTHCTFKGKVKSSTVTFTGNFNVELYNGVTDDRTKVVITTKTPGGQSIALTLTPKVN